MFKTQAMDTARKGVAESRCASSPGLRDHGRQHDGRPTARTPIGRAPAELSSGTQPVSWTTRGQGPPSTCVEIKILRRALRRVVLRAIFMISARWRGAAGSSPLDGASTAASSPRNDLGKNYRVHPTHCLISTQPSTRRRRGRRAPRRSRRRTMFRWRPSCCLWLMRRRR